MLPTLAVVFDFGSVTPMELILESEGLCELLFVCHPTSPYVARSMPLLEGAGMVLERDHSDVTAEALRRAGVSGIVTFGDTELSYASELAARLEFPFHSPETVAALSDKHIQRARLSERGVDAVRFAGITARDGVTAAVDHVGTPAVLKPRQGAASRNTSLVRTVEELTEAVKQCFAAGETSMILEEYLVGDRGVAGKSWGDFVSVESLVVDGRITHIGVTGKLPLAEPFRETGTFVPNTLPAPVEEQVRTATSKALEALGIRDGMCHTEFKLTAAGPRVIEVNGRLGGYMNDVYTRSTGLSLLRLTMEAALGQVKEVELVQAQKVAYQLWIAPPVWARSVSEVSGVEEVKALPGVRRVDIMRSAGAEVDWRKGTGSAVATVYGDAPDHAALNAAMTSVEQALVLRYER